MTRQVESLPRHTWEHDTSAGFRLNGSFSADGDGVSRELTRLIRRWANLRCRGLITPAEVASELAASPFADRFPGWIENWSQRDSWFCLTIAPGQYLAAPQCELSAQSAIIHQPDVRRLNGLDPVRGHAHGVR